MEYIDSREEDASLLAGLDGGDHDLLFVEFIRYLRLKPPQGPDGLNSFWRMCSFYVNDHLINNSVIDEWTVIEVQDIAPTEALRSGPK